MSRGPGFPANASPRCWRILICAPPPRRALGRALDMLPSTPGEGGELPRAIAPADLEALAWNRFLRLANRAFRRSHMGLAAIVAFVEMQAR